MRQAPSPLHHSTPLIIAIAVALTAIAPSAAAQTAAASSHNFAIPAQPLGSALNELARQADLQLGFPADLVAGKTSPGVSGRHTPQQALDRLLGGSGLSGSVQGQSVLVRPAVAAQSQRTVLPTVNVTATALVPVDLPASYAGGQVARGGRVGMLGNRDMLDTPFSSTQYTSQLVEDQQAQTIGDVLVNDPSVRNTYGRNAGREEFNIRGLTVFNYDVSYNGLYGVSPRNAASLIGIERVEVLRGPNALLNGMAPSGSLGGAINLVPKRAGADPLNRVTLSYMDDSQLGAHVDLARRFGDAKQWGVRLNAARRSGDTPINGSSERLDAVSLGLDYQGERARLEADFNYQDRTTRARSSLLFPPGAGIAIPSVPDNKTNIQPPWSYWHVKERAAVVRGEVDISPGLVAYGALGAMQYDFDSLQTTSLLQNAQGGLAARPYRLDEYVDTRTIEAGLRGRFDTAALRHQVVVSATDYTQDNGMLRQNGAIYMSDLYRPSIIPRPDIALGNAIPRTSESRLRSVAVADTVSTADGRVQLTLGARHQNVRTRTLDGVTGAQTASYDESAVTPMVALLFKPTSQFSLYGNYIEGLSQGPMAPAGSANAGQVFAPGKSKQIEVGAKYDMGRVATTVSLFQIERPSSLLDASTAPPTFRMDGLQRNRGLEVISQGEINRRVRVLAGVAYTQGKLVDTQDGINDGRTAPAVPRVQINVGAEWDPSFLSGLTLTARALRTGTQYVDAANTQQLPSWTRWDLGARYRFTAGGKRIVLRAALENVFDKDYWQSAAREGLTIGAPRTLLVSVSTDF